MYNIYIDGHIHVLCKVYRVIYSTVGNFRGGKLSQIIFRGKHFFVLPIGIVDWALLCHHNIHVHVICVTEGGNTAKFTKVFTHENFQLYDTNMYMYK